MRQQYHFRQSEKGVLAWDVFRLIDLSKSLPKIEIALDQIIELDQSFWYDLGGAEPTCRNVVEHARLIHQADLAYPIILCNEGRVMDGMHRVCKAVMLGETHITATRFPDYLEPDYINADPDDLPYDRNDL